MKKQEIRTFGRRKTKSLSERKIKLLDEITGKLSIKNINKNKKSILEIGFGNGEHLIDISVKNSNYNIIGAEPFINGIASLLSYIYDLNFNIKDKYKNIYIYPDDVRDILNKDSVNYLNIKYSYIFILHPDPWPKKKHHKRRLLNRDFLSVLSENLEKDGKILIGTDHIEYYEWIKEELKYVNNLKIRKIDTPIIKTKYQIKNKAGSDSPKYLILERYN